MATKDELITSIAHKTGESKAATHRFINALTESVIEVLVAGEEVKLTGFVAFSTVERVAREINNPRTGEKIHVPAKTVVRVRPLKSLSEAVEN